MHEYTEELMRGKLTQLRHAFNASRMKVKQKRNEIEVEEQSQEAMGAMIKDLKELLKEDSK
jgi:hypothetical protein